MRHPALPITLALVFCTAASGQSYGPQINLTPSTLAPQEVLGADLDGDGDLDAISASFGDDRIAWYENEGNGSFGLQRMISLEPDGVRTVFTIDFDGDGHIDVISASETDNIIGLHRNLGGGTFAPRRALASGMWVADLVAADLDNDGDTDVVSASDGAFKLSWYENDGNGNLLAEQALSTTTDASTALVVVDLDADGHLDVVFGHGTRVTWIRGVGGGSFAAPIDITATAFVTQSVSTEDVDGDGDLDVLSASSLDGKIAWYENLGAGTFGAEQVISTDTSGARLVHAHDLDGDGDFDVLAAGDATTWFENLGQGSFGAQQPLQELGAPGSVFIADFDGDGDADAFSANEGHNQVRFHESQGGLFDTAKIITGLIGESTFNSAPLLLVEDFDCDSDIDLVVPRANIALENDGRAYFANRSVPVPTLPNSRLESSADIDLDGTPDALIVREDELYWAKNLCAWSFDQPQQIGPSLQNFSTFPTVIAAADINQDGFTDLLWDHFRLSTFRNYLSWSKSQGSNAWVHETISETTFFDPQMALEDLDGDSDLDIFFFQGGLIRIEQLGLASGFFAPAETLDGAVRTAALADLNGDGHQDFIAATQNSVGYLLADANGGFGGFVSIAIGPINARRVAAKDLDNDGDIDVLFASNSGTIAWHENLGTGPFGPAFGVSQTIATDAPSAVSLVLNDLDSDGDLDIVVAGGRTIAWYERIGLVDCNGNGIHDQEELATGAALDCNGNGIIDECEISGGSAIDCNGNGVPDACDIAAGVATDCDGNGLIDDCELAADASLDLNQNGLLDRCESIGSKYCAPVIANSTGEPAELIAFGSDLLFFNDVTLAARKLPQNTFAMFFTSQTQGYAFPVPGSQGALCVLGLTGRYNQPGQIMPSGPDGTLVFPIDLLSIPTPTGLTVAQPGDTWNFQAWYRDVNPTVTSNFTDAVSVTFQ